MVNSTGTPLATSHHASLPATYHSTILPQRALHPVHHPYRRDRPSAEERRAAAIRAVHRALGTECPEPFRKKPPLSSRIIEPLHFLKDAAYSRAMEVYELMHATYQMVPRLPSLLPVAEAATDPLYETRLTAYQTLLIDFCALPEADAMRLAHDLATGSDEAISALTIRLTASIEDTPEGKLETHFAHIKTFFRTIPPDTPRLDHFEKSIMYAMERHIWHMREGARLDYFDTRIDILTTITRTLDTLLTTWDELASRYPPQRLNLSLVDTMSALPLFLDKGRPHLAELSTLFTSFRDSEIDHKRVLDSLNTLYKGHPPGKGNIEWMKEESARLLTAAHEIMSVSAESAEKSYSVTVTLGEIITSLVQLLPEEEAALITPLVETIGRATIQLNTPPPSG